MVVVTLSLGIGANVTMFSIIDRLLLRTPAHIVDVDRVVQVHSRWFGSQNVQSSQPYRLYKDLLAVSEFEQVAVTTPLSASRKSTIDFDGPYHRKQHGFDEPPK